MSTQLLHYRAWQGTFRRPALAIWPIARVALGLFLRRRLFWALYGFALLLFLMFFFGSFLLDWAETRIATTPIQIGKLRTDPTRAVRFIRQGLRILGGSQETFAYFFSYQWAMLMVILALAGSTLVGNDFTQRSLSFYLAKPIRPWHYVAGKCLAAGIIVHVVTTVPALGLFIQHGFGDWNYFLAVDYFTANNLGEGPGGWQLLLGILAYGMVLSIVLGLAIVAAATLLRTTMPLILGWVSMFLFLRIIAEVLVDGLHYDERWRLLDLWNNLSLVGRACLGFDPSRLDLTGGQPTFLEAALTLLGVCTVCLNLLLRRTRGVPIVR
jgi:ABC-2 type transport system permease protein